MSNAPLLCNDSQTFTSMYHLPAVYGWDQLITTLEQGKYFGELSILLGKRLCQASVRASERAKSADAAACMVRTGCAARMLVIQCPDFERVLGSLETFLERDSRLLQAVMSSII